MFRSERKYHRQCLLVGTLCSGLPVPCHCCSRSFLNSQAFIFFGRLPLVCAAVWCCSCVSKKCALGKPVILLPSRMQYVHFHSGNALDRWHWCCGVAAAVVSGSCSTTAAAAAATTHPPTTTTTTTTHPTHMASHNPYNPHRPELYRLAQPPCRVP